MTCSQAMFTDFVSARNDQTIADAVGLLEKHGIRALPILDAEGVMVGRFDFIVLLSHLLPGSIMMDENDTGFTALLKQNLTLASVVETGAELKCADRLRALLGIKLEDVMDTEISTVLPSTPLWEGIRLLVQHRGPLGVIEEDGGRLIGLITVQSVVRVLAQISEQH